MNNVQLSTAALHITRSTIITTPETKLIFIFVLMFFKATALPPVVKIGESIFIIHILTKLCKEKSCDKSTKGKTACQHETPIRESLSLAST